MQRVVCDFVVANFDAVEKTATYEKFMTEIEDDARPEMADILAKLLKAQRVKGKRQQEVRCLFSFSFLFSLRTDSLSSLAVVCGSGDGRIACRRKCTKLSTTNRGRVATERGIFCIDDYDCSPSPFDPKVTLLPLASTSPLLRIRPSVLLRAPSEQLRTAVSPVQALLCPPSPTQLWLSPNSSHRSMSSDSDAYDFPSDEDGFDEDAYASDGLAEGERESKKDGAEEESPINLEAFRRDWLAEAAVKPKETPVERPSLRKNAFAHFLLHPDLLDDLVLSSPILSTDDLRSLSLTNSHFYSATVDFLFRKISLPSFVRADILLARLQCNPDLASSIRSATLELLNPLETCTELYEVELLRIANEEKENKQHVEYFWAPGRQSSVGRKPWEQQVYNSLLPGEDYDDVRTKARVRRRLQIAQALGQEKEYSKDGLRKVIQQRTSSWPFSATKRSSDRLGKVLDQLAPHLRHLTLLPPLSHYLPNLASHLSNFSSLQSLSLLGLASPHLRFGHGCAAGTAILQNRFSFAFPALDLRLDGHGFVGGPMSVRKHKLESFLLYWRRARRDVREKGTEEDEEESGWKLEELEMRDVTIKRDPSHHPTTTPTAVTRVDSKKPPPTIRDSVWDPDPLLYLDLSAFVGSQAKLTSLILVEVSGVVPSTIYEAVSKCGSSLRTLVLLDLNIPCDSYTPNTSSHSQSLSIDFSFTRRTPTQRYGQRKTFDNLVSLADLWYRFDAPSSSPYQLADSTYWPSTTLAEALERCLSLRHLELGVSISRAGNSPYPPAMLDGLLVARPPLEVLKLRMGVEGPTQEDGLLDSEGWEKVAGQVEEIGTWKTVKMGQSGVMVSLRTSGRA